MAVDRDDFNYLIPPNLNKPRSSFKLRFMEAFRIEYGCTNQTQVAAIVGKHKARISQLFRELETTAPVTMAQFIAPIQTKHLRREILRAWMDEVFEEDFRDLDIEPRELRFYGPATMKQINKLIRQERLMLAGWMALMTSRTAEGEDREALLDMAVLIYQRLDNPGLAMEAVSDICDRALELRDYPRLSMGHLMRAVIQMTMAAGDFDEAQNAIKAAGDLISTFEDKSAGKKPYLTGTRPKLALYQMSLWITAAERGWRAANPKEIHERIAVLSAKVKLKGTPKVTRYAIHLFLARLHLLLGDAFKAQEHIDLAHGFGKGKISAASHCAWLTFRVKQLTESPDEVARYLAELAVVAGLRKDFYFKNQAEMALARITSQRLSVVGQ